MSNYKLMDVEIDNLIVNNDNPRFETLDDEISAINYFIAEQSDKIYALADDIVEQGLNPSENIISTPFDNEKQNFLVLEGNRRVTAVKLLINPNLIKNNDKVRKKFLKLKGHAKNKLEDLKIIKTVVFDDEEDSIHWLEVKHSGELGGVGTVVWDSQSKKRFDSKYKGKHYDSMNLIDFYKKNGNISEMKKSQLSSIAITNLERLIKDPYIRNFLGIKFKNEQMLTIYPREEILRPIRKIFDDLCSKDLQVNEIYTKNKRIKYVDSFSSENRPNIELRFPKYINARYEKIPDFEAEMYNNQNKKTTENRPSSQSNFFEDFDKNKKNPTKGNKNKKNEKNNKKKQRKQKRDNKINSLNRKNLIPNSTIMSISNARINNLYYELKTLRVEDFTNVAAASFRIFLELTFDYYIEIMKLDCKKFRIKLSDKMKLCKESLESKNLLDKNQIKPINTAISNQDSILSIDTLHAYIHNNKFQPLAKNLKIHWDNFEPFIEAIYTDINNSL